MSDLQSKTDEELNVMLAEMVGWKCEPTPFKRHSLEIVSRNGAWWHPSVAGCQFRPPDYCSSLDEVAKVEAGLTDEQQVSYAKTLWDSVGPTSDFKGSKGFWHVSFKHATAAARQRTIALIETLQP